MFIFQSWTCTLTVIENTVKEKKKMFLSLQTSLSSQTQERGLD